MLTGLESCLLKNLYNNCSLTYPIKRKRIYLLLFTLFGCECKRGREKKSVFFLPEFPSIQHQLKWRGIFDKPTQWQILQEIEGVASNHKIYLACLWLAAYPRERLSELIKIKEKDFDFLNGSLEINLLNLRNFILKLYSGDTSYPARRRVFIYFSFSPPLPQRWWSLGHSGCTEFETILIIIKSNITDHRYKLHWGVDIRVSIFAFSAVFADVVVQVSGRYVLNCGTANMGGFLLATFHQPSCLNKYYTSYKEYRPSQLFYPGAYP